MITIDIANRVVSAFGYLPDMGTVRGGMGAAYVDAVAKGAVSRLHTQYLKRTELAEVYVGDTPFANLTLHNTDTGARYVFDNENLNNAFSNVLAPPPMVSVTRQKQIITTTVDGSDSQVVESFGMQPYDITLSGIMVDVENHCYPSVKVQQLRELFNSNVIFDVLDSKLMADLGIDSLYFTSLDKLEVLVEYQDTVKYVLKAKSIKPLEFFI